MGHSPKWLLNLSKNLYEDLAQIFLNNQYLVQIRKQVNHCYSMSHTICPSMNFYFVLTFSISTRLLQKAKLERAPGTTGSYFPLAQTHGRRARVASENPAVRVESRFWQLVQGELYNYQFVFCLPMEICVFTYTTGFILTQE